MKPLASPHIMKNSLLFTLALLSFGLCHPAVKDIHHGIRKECDGGTAWERVEVGDCPLTLPTQDVQPVIKCTWANRRFCCSKKPRLVQAKRHKKVWSRSNVIGILLLLLLAGDVETNPGPTTDEQRLLQDELPQGVIREAPSGVPLYPIRLSEANDTLKPGAHLVYQVCGELYRPCYRSALVLEVEDTRIHVIKNSSDGVKTEWLDFTDSHFIVVYLHCRYTADEAVERAEQRLHWGENCYHCLNNNSHHFVTWAKTGRENPLADIIESLTYHKDNSLTPVLTKVSITDLRDMKEGDHIMAGTQHYLVASTDTARNMYTGYTCRKGKVVKEEHTLNARSTFRIDYEESFSPKEAIANAEQELEQGEWSDSDKYGSDKFVTKMKTGKKHSFNEHSLFMEENTFSRTQVVPGIAVNEGDHLVVKDKYGNYQSVLVLKHAGQSTFIVTPDLNSEDLKRYGIVKFEEDTEVYRINYKQSLPVDDVFRRAMSDRGFEVLTDCRSELSKFVSWTKTGRKEILDVLQLKSQIAQLCPFQREKILSVNEIQVGDHLIRSYPTYWWHFMVTEVHPSDPFKFKTIYCNNNHISETEETLDPSKNDVYRILYPESLPVETAIERARSKLGTFHFSPLGRMWFVRWAKTGSEDGIEVDFLINNAMPASKSRICTFAQLNPGDYLVEEEDKMTPWHHYLVTEVTSHSSCSAIESWNWTVTVRTLAYNEKSTYYRLNYNDGACISPGQVIVNAQGLLGQHIITPAHYKYKRQKLVNYLKTGNGTDVVKIDSLQNDRILLRREKVWSALELQPGDHIECQACSRYHHMMVVKPPQHDRTCKVIHFGNSKLRVQEKEIDIFKDGDNVFRIKYPERCIPDQSIQHLRKFLPSSVEQPYPVEKLMPSDASSQIHPKYELTTNNFEHLIMEATVGEPLSIQVTEQEHFALQRTTAALMVAGASLGAVSTAHECTTAVARGAAHTGLQVAAKATARSVAKASALAATKVSAHAGIALGVTAGFAAGVNIAIEGPSLARDVYKLHRKKAFHQISQVEFERSIVKKSFTTANAVVGGVGGVVVGQIFIPVPILGPVVGGITGSVVGQLCGRAEGWAASRLISEPRPVTLLPLIRISFIDNPPLTY